MSLGLISYWGIQRGHVRAGVFVLLPLNLWSCKDSNSNTEDDEGCDTSSHNWESMHCSKVTSCNPLSCNLCPSWDGANPLHLIAICHMQADLRSLGALCMCVGMFPGVLPMSGDARMHCHPGELPGVVRGTCWAMAFCTPAQAARSLRILQTRRSCAQTESSEAF